jgi:hypothetical protein
MQTQHHRNRTSTRVPNQQGTHAHLSDPHLAPTKHVEVCQQVQSAIPPQLLLLPGLHQLTHVPLEQRVAGVLRARYKGRYTKRYKGRYMMRRYADEMQHGRCVLQGRERVRQHDRCPSSHTIANTNNSLAFAAQDAGSDSSTITTTTPTSQVQTHQEVQHVAARDVDVELGGTGLNLQPAAAEEGAGEER